MRYEIAKDSVSEIDSKIALFSNIINPPGIQINFIQRPDEFYSFVCCKTKIKVFKINFVGIYLEAVKKVSEFLVKVRLYNYYQFFWYLTQNWLIHYSLLDTKIIKASAPFKLASVVLSKEVQYLLYSFSNYFFHLSQMKR